MGCKKPGWIGDKPIGYYRSSYKLLAGWLQIEKQENKGGTRGGSEWVVGNYNQEEANELCRRVLVVRRIIKRELELLKRRQKQLLN